MLYNVYTTLLAVVSVPILYWTGLLVKRIIYIARCRHRVAKLPGMPLLPIIGDLHHIPKPMDQRFNELMLKNTEKYPYAFHTMVQPHRATIQVVHPKTVKLLMKSTEPKDDITGGIYMHLMPWLGRGLLISHGPQWFRNRRLLTPAFHFDILKPYMLVYNECADIIMEKWLPSACDGKTINIYSDVSLCTLNVIMRCAFSYTEDVQRLGMTHPYVKCVYSLAEIAQTRIFKPWAYIDWIFNLTSEGRRFKSMCDYVHKVADDIIEKRKQYLIESDNLHPVKNRLDFLDILLAAKDDDGSGLTATEIRQEVDTFLFEGHDTTASGVSWILYAMAGHPEYQQRAREEIDDVLEGRGDNAYLEWDDMNNLPYFTRCIKEALRMYTPVPAVVRRLTKPLEVEGVELLPDTNVVVGFHGMHHNPLVWGEDHMEYKPDRFLHENISKMDSYAFCPFAAGPRNCIGQNFAMNEMKVLVGRILHRFILDRDNKYPAAKTVPFLVTRSTTGIHLKMTPRNTATIS